MTPDLSRRNPRTEEVVLSAALELLAESGLFALTMEGVAARAGVGKQTIYRWWPSTGAIAIDALLREADPQIGFPDTKDLRADLSAVLTAVVALLAEAELGRHFVSCLVDSQRDQALAERFNARVFAPVRERYRARLTTAREAGELASDVSFDDILDTVFGAVWLRALTRPDDLDAEFAGRVVRVVLDGVSR